MPAKDPQGERKGGGSGWPDWGNIAATSLATDSTAKCMTRPKQIGH